MRQLGFACMCMYFASKGSLAYMAKPLAVRIIQLQLPPVWQGGKSSAEGSHCGLTLADNSGPSLHPLKTQHSKNKKEAKAEPFPCQHQ